MQGTAWLVVQILILSGALVVTVLALVRQFRKRRCSSAQGIASAAGGSRSPTTSCRHQTSGYTNVPVIHDS